MVCEHDSQCTGPGMGEREQSLLTKQTTLAPASFSTCRETWGKGEDRHLCPGLLEGTFLGSGSGTADAFGCLDMGWHLPALQNTQAPWGCVLPQEYISIDTWAEAAKGSSTAAAATAGCGMQKRIREHGA